MTADIPFEIPIERPVSLGRGSPVSEARGAKGSAPSITGWMWADGSLSATGVIHNYRSMDVSMWSKGRLWLGGAVVNSEVM